MPDMTISGNSSSSPVNLLTSSHTDQATHTPAYKETSVNLRVLGEQGENPLPRGNFRNGTPTPQSGVEVARKWQRPDYHMPGTAGRSSPPAFNSQH